ncbi:MAG TPA: ribosome-associated translation inhibitor RaiA [Bacteroidia bacterium]|jgi:putative sigma-54 modulation protein
MEIIIQSLHFTAGQQITDYTREKVNKLLHFYSRVEKVNVVLKFETRDKPENKVCEVRLSIPGKDLFAESIAETFEEAINETVEALEQQIKKMKAKFAPR